MSHTIVINFINQDFCNNGLNESFHIEHFFVEPLEIGFDALIFLLYDIE
jgi:hypothetical protein